MQTASRVVAAVIGALLLAALAWVAAYLFISGVHAQDIIPRGCSITAGTITCGGSSLSPATSTLTNTHIFVGNASNVATDVAASGDCTVANTGALTCTKTGGTSFGALATVVPGTGVATALGVNVGSPGAPVLFNGALGTPSSGVATNLTGTASGLVAGSISPGATLNTLAGQNLTGTTSTAAFVMMGYGGTCTITPTKSTRVVVDFYGDAANSVSADGTVGQIAFGTGAAPSNGAAASGTVVSGSMFLNAVGAVNGPFGLHGLVTGLTPGVAVWFDVQLKSVTGGTSTLSNVNCRAVEQ